jgi:hypothetical protein
MGRALALFVDVIGNAARWLLPGEASPARGRFGLDRWLLELGPLLLLRPAGIVPSMMLLSARFKKKLCHHGPRRSRKGSSIDRPRTSSSDRPWLTTSKPTFRKIFYCLYCGDQSSIDNCVLFRFHNKLYTICVCTLVTWILSATNIFVAPRKLALAPRG